MRPFFKTWLTICLLLPLAAHATNREQRLPAGFTGHTAKSEAATTPLQVAQNQTPTSSKTKPSSVAKQPSKSKAPSEAHNTKHKAPVTAQAGKGKQQNTAQVSKGKHQATAQVNKGKHPAIAHAAKPAAAVTLPVVADVEVQEPSTGTHTRRHGKQVDSLASAKHTAQQMSAKQSSEVLSRAVKVLGTPYAWGGTTPKKGFDCSGLVKYAFKDVHTVDLPRTSNAMAEGHGLKVARKDLKPGDLLFFNIEGREVNHVAIYLGNDRFIHAPRTGKSVSIDTLDKPYWDEHYVVAKRVLPKQMQQPMLRLSQR